MSLRAYIKQLLDDKDILINQNTYEAEKNSKVQNITVKLKDGTLYEDDYVTQWYLNRLRHFKHRNAEVIDVEKINDGSRVIMTIDA